MRGYLRLFFSVLLLSILVVLISRVLIAKKIDKGEIEKNLRSLILTHIDGTDVDLESFTYEIGSHLEIQIEKLAILDDSSREKLLGVEEVKLIVPIMTVLTSKGKIKSYIKRISYFSNTQKHLIKKINTTSQDKGYGKYYQGQSGQGLQQFLPERQVVGGAIEPLGFEKLRQTIQTADGLFVRFHQQHTE